jgi:uncharacterized protein YkwD
MPTGLSIALSLLILTHPAPNVHAAGTPTSAETPINSTTNTPSPRPVAGYVYTVQPDDTLWDIAVAHGITVEALIAANDLPDPRRLQAGQKIFVPAQPAVVPRKPTPTPQPTAVNTPMPETGATPVPAADLPPVEAPAATPAATPSPEPTPTPEPLAAPGLAPEIIGWPAEFLRLINEKRATQGVPAVEWSPELALAAQAHAADCAQRNRGSHIGSDGAVLRTRLDRLGYQASWASENWANAQSVQHAFGLWWNEPRGNDPHRRNILDPRYTEIGIGVARGPWGYYFIADFGSR